VCLLEDLTMAHQGRVLCLFALVCFLMSHGCMQSEHPPKVGDPSPRIDLYDLKGRRVVLPDDFRNDVVFIRFWDCCSYDMNEMSRIDQIHRKYERNGLRIVTIHTGGTRAFAEYLVSMLKIRFPVLFDLHSTAAKCYGVSRLPCTFILDRNSVIRAKIVGRIEGSVTPAYERVIIPLLN
jgi:hypothetical protein